MRLILAFGLLFTLAACGSASHTYTSPSTPPVDQGKGGEPDPGGGGIAAGEAPNFSDLTAAFRRNRCLDCHSVKGKNKGKVNLETFANAKAVAKDIMEDIDDGEMPKGGPLVNAADSAIIDAWVASVTAAK